MTDKQTSSYMRYMSNPKGFTLKKWFAEILKEKYPPHESIIERVGTSLVTEKDLQDLGKLITEVYEVAYMKAINDYREQFEKMGVKINIVPQKPSSNQDSHQTDTPGT